MNNLLDKLSSNLSSVEPQIDSTADKHITFKLQNYLFALPSRAILKIVATPPPSQGGMVAMGLVQLEQYSIQTIDLKKLLGLEGRDTASALRTMNSAKASIEKTSTEKTSTEKTFISPTEETRDNPPFLMVLQDSDQELWGIAVDNLPDVMDIPRYALKSVPPEKRMTRALRWVSHVVTYDLGRDRHTLLLLDTAALLSYKQVESKPQSPNLSEAEPFIKTEALETEETYARKEEMYA